MPGVFAIVLAAGLSRRYGDGSKLAVSLAGKPLGLHIADTLAALQLAGRIAVCRQGDDLADAYRTRGFEVIFNPDSGRGQASSLRLGVTAAIGMKAEAVLICLADMPFVTSGHLDALIRVGETADIVASSSAGEINPTPPARFASRHFPALLALEGDKGARSLLAQAHLVEAAADELADFDTPDDFTR